MATFHSAADAHAQDGIVFEASERLDFVRRRDEDLALGFPVIRFGSSRRLEVEQHCPSFSNQYLISISFAVDFVLESGNGELDVTVDLSVERQPLEGGLVFGGSPPTPSPDTPTFPLTVQNFGNLANHGIADESQSPEYPPIGEGQGASPRPRSWPLRDPEEALLLKHFVDRTSSFVSGPPIPKTAPATLR